jgi:hypothetical protein
MVYTLPPPMRYAILVGGKEKKNPELNLGVASLIEELRKEFLERMFNVVSMNSDVTRMILEEKLKEIFSLCIESPRHPKIIFYYAGHQNNEGFELEDGIYSREELIGLLQRIKGEKLGIFDCCFAGLLKRHATRDLAILAATAEDRVAYASQHPDEENRRTIIGREILKFMREHPENFALGDLYTELELQLKGITNLVQLPEMAGRNIFMFPGKGSFI